MLVRNTGVRFGLVAKLLHWIIAVLLIGLIWLGWYMLSLSYYDKWYHDALITHRALGLLVLVLALYKAAWLVVSPTPRPPAAHKPWEYRVSKLVHWVLFMSMFVLPVTGYVISTSEGAAVPVFDWFDVPALFDADEPTRDLAIETHFYAAYAILAVALLHAAAAFKHQIVDGDGTLKRML